MIQQDFTVKRALTRKEMGECAAADTAACITALLRTQETVNMIFAAAPSQNEFLQALIGHKEIDFSRINAFHMDEYVGLSKEAPQRFGHFLAEAIFDRVPFKNVFYIDGDGDPAAECARYGALLEEYKADIVCMGIGENGHIAFNDPHEADFNDPVLVKKVSLDEVCRNQQVNDGCFARLEDVPKYALTLTIPALARARYHFCMVPAATKAQAVFNTVHGEIGPACPATVLRLCRHGVLYVDADSAALLGKVY